MPNITCLINQTLFDRLEKTRIEYPRAVPKVGPRDGYTISEIIRFALDRGLESLGREIEAATAESQVS